MKHLQATGRLTMAVAVALVASACADSATAPVTPLAGNPGASGAIIDYPLPPSPTHAALEGKVLVCKEIATGTPSATFDFDVSINGGAPTTVSVPSGTCALVHTSLVSTSETVVITEQPKTNWFLDDVDIERLRVFVSGGVDTWDIPTATVTTHVNNDLGRKVIFYNDYTPPEGCTLTQGYWKTHSSYGPAKYDATWAQLANGADTPFFLSGKTWYEVFWTAPAGNPYYNLAHQYMAAKLNILNGASAPTAVTNAIASAEALFAAYTPAAVAALPKQNATRKSFISLASTLDAYNNGLADGGPAHCN